VHAVLRLAWPRPSLTASGWQPGETPGCDARADAEDCSSLPSRTATGESVFCGAGVAGIVRLLRVGCCRVPDTEPDQRVDGSTACAGSSTSRSTCSVHRVTAIHQPRASLREPWSRCSTSSAKSTFLASYTARLRVPARRIQTNAAMPVTRNKSRMRSLCTSGCARGAARKGGPCRDLLATIRSCSILDVLQTWPFSPGNPAKITFSS